MTKFQHPHFHFPQLNLQDRWYAPMSCLPTIWPLGQSISGYRITIWHEENQCWIKTFALCNIQLIWNVNLATNEHQMDKTCLGALWSSHSCNLCRMPSGSESTNWDSGVTEMVVGLWCNLGVLGYSIKDLKAPIQRKKNESIWSNVEKLLWNRNSQ